VFARVRHEPGTRQAILKKDALTWNQQVV